MPGQTPDLYGWSNSLEANGIEATFRPLPHTASFIHGFNGLGGDVSLKGNLQLMGRREAMNENLTVVRIRLTIGLGGADFLDKDREFYLLEAEQPIRKVLHTAEIAFSPNCQVNAGQIVTLPFTFPLPPNLPPSFDTTNLHWSKTFCAYRLEAFIHYRKNPERTFIDVPAPLYSPASIRVLLSPSVPLVKRCDEATHDLDWGVTLDHGFYSFDENVVIDVDLKPRADGANVKTSEVTCELLECYDLPHADASSKGLSNVVTVSKSVAPVPSKTGGTLHITLPIPKQAPVVRARNVLRPEVNADGMWEAVAITHKVRVTLKRSKFNWKGKPDGKDVIEISVVIGSCDRRVAEVVVETFPELLELDMPRHYENNADLEKFHRAVQEAAQLYRSGTILPIMCTARTYASLYYPPAAQKARVRIEQNFGSRRELRGKNGAAPKEAQPAASSYEANVVRPATEPPSMSTAPKRMPTRDDSAESITTILMSPAEVNDSPRPAIPLIRRTKSNIVGPLPPTQHAPSPTVPKFRKAVSSPARVPAQQQSSPGARSEAFHTPFTHFTDFTTAPTGTGVPLNLARRVSNLSDYFASANIGSGVGAGGGLGGDEMEEEKVEVGDDLVWMAMGRGDGENSLREKQPIGSEVEEMDVLGRLPMGERVGHQPTGSTADAEEAVKHQPMRFTAEEEGGADYQPTTSVTEEMALEHGTIRKLEQEGEEALGNQPMKLLLETGEEAVGHSPSGLRGEDEASASGHEWIGLGAEAMLVENADYRPGVDEQELVENQLIDGDEDLLAHLLEEGDEEVNADQPMTEADEELAAVQAINGDEEPTAHQPLVVTPAEETSTEPASIIRLASSGSETRSPSEHDDAAMEEIGKDLSYVGGQPPANLSLTSAEPASEEPAKERYTREQLEEQLRELSNLSPIQSNVEDARDGQENREGAEERIVSIIKAVPVTPVKAKGVAVASSRGSPKHRRSIKDAFGFVGSDEEDDGHSFDNPLVDKSTEEKPTNSLQTTPGLRNQPFVTHSPRNPLLSGGVASVFNYSTQSFGSPDETSDLLKEISEFVEGDVKFLDKSPLPANKQPSPRKSRLDLSLLQDSDDDDDAE
ncbi:hypothetical protein HK101_006135 [Irineochytrium annulatum]|nr:hypothetical protein HK101_006135 [Irineochytrium annulatum]